MPSWKMAHTTLPSYSGRLSVILKVKHLAKRKHSFFWRFWREVTIQPVSRFFRNGVCSFLCSKSMKIRTRSALFLSESCGRHIQPISILFEKSKAGRMVYIELLGQHSGCQAFILFHSCQKCMVDLFLLICEVCIVRFEASFNLAFADCSFAKKFVEIAKWLSCIPTFLEVIESMWRIWIYFRYAFWITEKTRLYLWEKFKQNANF